MVNLRLKNYSIKRRSGHVLFRVNGKLGYGHLDKPSTRADRKLIGLRNLQSQIIELREELSDKKYILEQVNSELDLGIIQIRRLEQQLVEKDASLEAFFNSRSWILMAPFRDAVHIFRVAMDAISTEVELLIHRKYRPVLIPMHDLERIEPNHGFDWRSMGSDPQFILKGGCPRGWSKVSWQGAVDCPQRAVLYVDRGQGFTQNDVINLGIMDSLELKEYSIWVHLGVSARTLRLDPGEVKGRISIRNFQLVRVSRADVFLHAFRQYINRHELSWRGQMNYALRLLRLSRHKGINWLWARVKNELIEYNNQSRTLGYEHWSEGLGFPDIEQREFYHTANMFRQVLSSILQKFLIIRSIVRKVLTYIRLYGLKGLISKVRQKNKLNNRIIASEIIIPELILLDDLNTDVERLNESVSIVIPTKNAGESFRNLLMMLRNQKGLSKIEIVVVDSGSIDDTVSFASEYGAKVVVIRPEDFTHSYSRNLGSDHTECNYLLFTTQDALPPSDTWLYELIKVHIANDVAAVSCAESPRAHADLFYRVLAWNHYRFLEVDKYDRILSCPNEINYVSLRKNGQLSDIACLIKKDIFQRYKYRYNYGEDLDLGIRLIKDGYKIAFLSSIRIIHSHDRPAFYYLKRGYVDNVFLKNMFDDFTIPVTSIDSLIWDIFFTHDLLEELINQLALTKVYYTPKELYDKLIIQIERLRNSKHKSDSSIRISNNLYIDDELKVFLNKLPIPLPENINFNSILTDSLFGFINITFEYLQKTYDLLDDFILEDFKYSVFKMFALVTGANIAYCFLNDETNSLLHDLNRELVKGV